MTRIDQVVAALDEWSGRVLKNIAAMREEQREPVERAALARGSILSLPVTQEAIALAERRLGIELPPDYKTFVGVSNGLVIPEVEGHTVEILPIEEIDYFVNVDPESFQEWSGGDELTVPLDCMPPDVQEFAIPYPNTEMLRRSILLTQVVNTGGVVICPFTARGPWEVWEFGPWTGCVRYRSFASFVARKLA